MAVSVEGNNKGVFNVSGYWEVLNFSLTSQKAEVIKKKAEARLRQAEEELVEEVAMDKVKRAEMGIP